MINKANLLDALHLYRTKNDVWQEFKNDFPEVLADLTSFEGNPNCSCGGRLTKYFTKILNENPEALNAYDKYPEELKERTTIRKKQNTSESLSGQIFEIDKGDKNWDLFVNGFLKMSNKSFHSFSVVEREDKIAVYFI
jgi:hypothetical protein